MALGLAFLCLIPAALAFGFGAGNGDSFMLISVPRMNKVAYVQIPRNGLNPFQSGTPPRDLILDIPGPAGIAIDDVRKMLYVAAAADKRILAYPLLSRGGRLQAGVGKTVHQGQPVKSLAVDGHGNLYVTNEDLNIIMRYKVRDLEVNNFGNPELVYRGSAADDRVLRPGGIAVDNQFVYWVNKDGPNMAMKGEKVLGALTTSQAGPKHIGSLSQDDSNSRPMGLCLVRNNVFFTSKTKTVAVASAHAIADPDKTPDLVNVMSNFTSPRGCVFDGENTVYISDMGFAADSPEGQNPSAVPGYHQGRVYAVNATQKPGLSSVMQPFLEQQGVFGVAIHTPTTLY